RLLPKRLASAPTTAVSDQSMAYGTTAGSQHGVGASPPLSLQLSGSLAQPVIITTDEKGHATHAHASLQPKGKLKVSIVGARGLLVAGCSQPYVVSTYESLEFVNNAPAAAGRSPAARPGVPMGVRAGLQRQASQLEPAAAAGCSSPTWNHEAVFDVVGTRSQLEISVYDAARDDAFLGQVRLCPDTAPARSGEAVAPQWVPLRARVVGERVAGALQVRWVFWHNDAQKAYGPGDFDVLRLLGKGTFGQVYQVRNRDNGRIYAMKILSKKLIVKKKEIAHTIGERNILVRTSAAASPFIVGLKFSFQTEADLYLVTDYMSGGELFWHLQKEGRFGEERAKFYIAELVLALEHLHDNDIVYRDLKPENILLDANGHIALCDFGLSKANLNNDGTTNTFCGTTEYLAPEVLLDESGYTKMVDFWSLGVLIFEMCCGWSPFYADNTQQMYKNIAFGKVRFPKEVLSPEGRSFVKGLLNRNPKHRLGAVRDARELKDHAFFQDVDWALLRAKNIPPPFKPHLASETDTSNFDPEFTSESTSVLKKQLDMGSTPLSPGIQANFKGFTYVDASAIDEHFSRLHRYNAFRSPASFIPGNPNLPPDDEVIEDQDDDDKDDMDIDHDHHLESEEFVNGRFDL
ncbi:kinase-like protein, partial [Metschnikowia bicuspidata var. bicuspidata NRRL YB-4993]